MRERLRQSEALLVGAPQDREEDAAHRVGIGLSRPQRLERRDESVLVMLEQLLHPASQVVEGLPVGRQYASDGKLGKGAEGIEEVAQRIRPRPRVQADVRRDLR